MLEQNISAIELIKLIGIIISIIGGAYAIIRQIKKERDKFATKEYVEQELDVMDAEIKSIKDKQEDTRDDLKYIRSRIDKLIDLHLKDKAS